MIEEISPTQFVICSEARNLLAQTIIFFLFFIPKSLNPKVYHYASTLRVFCKTPTKVFIYVHIKI